MHLGPSAFSEGLGSLFAIFLLYAYIMNSHKYFASQTKGGNACLQNQKSQQF
jgi:hypothetical protein